MKLVAKLSVLCLILAFTTGCSLFHHQHGGGTVTPPPHQISVVGIDPTISWNSVVTACNGTTLTGVTYNVYISTSAIPTTSSSVTGCTGTFNFVDTTKITATATALTTLSYNSTVGIGSYFTVIEAVAATVKGIASVPTAFQVQNVPGAATGVQVSWNKEELQAPKNLRVR